MNTSVSARALIEGGLLSAVAVIVSLLSISVPLLGTFIQVFLPLPLVLIVIRHSLKVGIIASVVTALLIAMLVHPLYGIKALFGFALMGVVMGWCFRNNVGAGKTLIYSAFSAVFSILVSFAIGFFALEIDPIALQKLEMEKITALAIEAYTQAGKTPDEIIQAENAFRNTINFFMIVIPAMFLLASFGLAYINFKLARSVLNRMDYITSDLPLLKEWDFSKHVLIGWSLGLISAIMGKHYFGVEALSYKLGVNVFFVFSMFLFLQGMAVFSFFATRHNLNRPLRFMFILFAFLDLRMTMFVVFGGAFDLLANFRRLNRKS